jgi:hypothetical protein
VAALLNVKVNTVYDLVKRRKILPPLPCFHSYRWVASDFMEWLAGQQKEVAHATR